MTPSPITFGSLFAGIGGLDLGLERAGLVCKWQVEIDDYARRVLAKHWPNVRRWDDICTFPPDANRDTLRNESRRGSGQSGASAPEFADDGELWNVDLICGGFPCQDISYAGAGAGLEGERSGLFFEAVRVVRQLRPRFVLLENVAALLTRGLDVVLGTLASLGYDAEWHCIPAAAVGAPHIRDRVFIYAHQQSQPTMPVNEEVARVSGSVAHPAGVRCQGRLLERPMEGTQCNPRTGFSQQPNRSDWWATEPDVGRVANGVSSRVDRLRGLGNAVVPQVAEWIGRQIVKSYEDSA